MERKDCFGFGFGFFCPKRNKQFECLFLAWGWGTRVFLDGALGKMRLLCIHVFLYGGIDYTCMAFPTAGHRSRISIKSHWNVADEMVDGEFGFGQVKGVRFDICLDTLCIYQPMPCHAMPTHHPSEDTPRTPKATFGACCCRSKCCFHIYIER